MDMQVDAQLIRNERLKRAWSQEQLAQVSGLGLRTVQRIESGGNASLESIKALAAVLELPVETLLATPPSFPPPRFNLFRPWRTFVAGCTATLVTMGGFVAMQGARAEQVDMDFAVRLHDEELTRSRLVGEAGSAAVMEVAEVLRISITPTVTADDAIFLDIELYLFEDGEYRLNAKPKMLVFNGRKGVLRVGRETIGEDAETRFESLEFEITPMLE